MTITTSFNHHGRVLRALPTRIDSSSYPVPGMVIVVEGMHLLGGEPFIMILGRRVPRQLQ